MDMNELFGTTDTKQKQYEIVKAQLIKSGVDEKVAEYQAKEKIFTPAKLEKIHLKQKVDINAVTFYFKNKEDLDLVCKHFKLSAYNGYNTDKVDLLISMLKEREASVDLRPTPIPDTSRLYGGLTKTNYEGIKIDDSALSSAEDEIFEEQDPETNGSWF